jgi:uncharacterized membrane protein
MSYQFYKILHLMGLVSLVMGIAFIVVLAATKQLHQKSLKILGYTLHGVGATLVFVSGFGMSARLQIFGNIPGWMYQKILIWVLITLGIVLFKRLRTPWLHATLLLLLVYVAIHLALFKSLPFLN